MSIPVASALGFALWTLVILFSTVGVYRWSRIFTGRASISQWTANPDDGSAWYGRAMRAHMNCIETLPVFACIVFAVESAGVASATLDTLALTVLGTRVVQSTVHIALPQSERIATLRFLAFFSQILAMFAMVGSLLVSL